MRKTPLALGLSLFCLMLFNSEAEAVSGEAVYDKGYSTFTATAIACTTGTTVQLNATRQLIGFNVAEYRLQNTDGADSVYIGQTPSVSSFTVPAVAMAAFGEPLSSGSNRTWLVGSNPALADQPDVELWCIAADAAGAAAVIMSVVSFGYR